MKKSLKEFFPKLIFALFFVYVVLLGVMNLFIVNNRDSIEVYLATLLEAQDVHIGDISNLPLIFISGTEFVVTVNDELSLTIKDIYLQYRPHEIFTGEFERIIRDIRIEYVSFSGHTVEIKQYIKTLSNKFSNVDSPDPDTITAILENVASKITIRKIDFAFNSMTEFWHSATIDNLEISLQKNSLYWDARLKLHSIWSNQVFLAESSAYSRGTISNLVSPNGYVNTTIYDLNFIGLPLVQTNLHVNVDLLSGKPTLNIINYSTNNQINFSKEDGMLLSVKSVLDIAYRDFEEFLLLDYAFKPGRWTFDMTLSHTDDWKFDLSFKSPQHPEYGLVVTSGSLTKDKLYSVLIDLNTHYFGGIRGDLQLPIRKGLYPLPSGVLYFDNTRFIINGLVFSGSVIADVVPNKNEIDVALLDVKMNNGLIGNTAAKFEFTPNGDFNIYPRFYPNSAVDIAASIGTGVSVDLKANDVNGDFVAQNIKIPIFGIKDSMYKGMVTIRKKDRKSSLFLNGYLKGFLDEEEQIDAIFDIKDNHIKIPRFYITSPDILLSGEVLINSLFSNTIVKIDGQGAFYSNDMMPIDVTVDIQKYETTVVGLVDNQVPIKTLTVGMDTDFTLDFTDYSLQKFGWLGAVDANLVMRFDEFGITRFSVQEGKWNVANRAVILDFDSMQNLDTGVLDVVYFRFGLDRDVLDGYGYITFLNDQFGWSFRFNRGGLFQFNMGRYIVKSRLNLVNFTIDNVFNFEMLESIAFLRTEETETSTIQADLTMDGTWDNLRYRGKFSLEGEEPFHLAVGNFDFSADNLIVDKLRLRHSQLLLDADIKSTTEEQKMNGSFAYQNVVKSDFSIDYQKTNNLGIVNYNFPNFYMLSKKPLQLKGKIFHDDQEYLFLSDHAKYGVVGTFTTDNSWNVALLNESLRLFSEGVVDQDSDSLQANVKLDVDLNKLVPSGDLRRTKGALKLDSTITGSITEPLISGQFDMSNLDLNFKSLRNRILMSGTQSIFISNNLVTIPDLTVESRGGGTFGLDGSIHYENQSIETADIRFYSKTPRAGEDYSLLAWKMDMPLITVRGNTYIKEIHISGDLEELLLFADIQAENINFNLELDDTLGNSAMESNPMMAMLEGVNLDINIDFANRTRFSSHLFNIDFEQIHPIKIEGSVDDMIVSGEFSIDGGSLNYLNSSLDVSSGSLAFSRDESDLYPTIIINTDTSKEYQGDLLDISVAFEGKLPNVELTAISSTPSRSRTELLNIIAGVVSIGDTTGSTTQDLLANSVGIAENTLFTNPLNRRIQQFIPFVDSFQLKTDILGNLTRSANEETGVTASGLDIFNGSEVEIGWYIPNIKGLQLAYNYSLESTYNTGVDASTLNQIHKGGISYIRLLPYQNQVGTGVNVQIDLAQETQVEGIWEASWRKKF